MHASLGEQVLKSSSAYKWQELERQSLADSMQATTKSLNALPLSFATKRQQLAAHLDQKREALTALNQKITHTATGLTSPNNALFTYSVWLRISVMLLCAYLVHLFFEGFSIRKEL
jgi:hypothetical protein